MPHEETDRRAGHSAGASRPDVWAKLRSIGALLAGVGALCVPVALGILSNAHNTAIKTRDLSLEYTRIAVSVLSQEPTAANRGVREWATQLIDRYSEVPLSQKAGDALRDSIRLGSPRQDYPLEHPTWCGNHNPPHVALSTTHLKELEQEYGCKDWRQNPAIIW